MENKRSKSAFRMVWEAMKPDIFTTRIFFDPLAVPLTIILSKVRWINANMVTFSALVPGLVGAWWFAMGRFGWGATGYYLFFLLDSVDGKLARLRVTTDPLGAFYDFTVDRIVIGAMLLGMGWAFIQVEAREAFLSSQIFLIFFFLKDVFDLKWKEAGVESDGAKNHASIASGFLARYKIHFKPGQLLSCFIMFIAGPVTGAYVLCSCLAIACVVFSLIYNVFIPWSVYLRKGR